MSQPFPWLETLLNTKKISRKDAKVALEQSLQTNQPLEKVLIESGRLTREAYLEALSEVTQIPSIDMRKAQIHYSTAQVVPQSMARRFNLLCIAQDAGRIVVAMMDPLDTFALEYVRMRTGQEIEPRGAYLPDLLEVMDRVYSVKVEHINADTPTSSSSSRSKSPPSAQGSPRFVVASSDTSKRGRQVELMWRDLAATQPARVIPLGGTSSARGLLPADADEFQALRAMVEIGAELSATLDSERLIYRILQICLDLTHSEACSLILIGEQGNDLYFKGAIGARAEEVRQVRFPFDEHSVAGYSIKHRKSMRINDVDADPRHNKDVDKAVDFRTRSLLAVPVLWQGEPLGVLEAVNNLKNRSYTETDQKYLELLASQAAVALSNSVLVGRLQNFFHEAVDLLVDILESTDLISRSHLVEVARFVAEMGRYLGLSEPEMERLVYAGLLHDLGKTRVKNPDDPAHALIGGEILSRFRIFSDIAPIVRHHHERYDGTGFPEGLRGEQIPRLARMLALSEAWVEELAQEGPEGRSKVMDSIRSRIGTWFDPSLRQAFEYATEVLHRGLPQATEASAHLSALLTSRQQELSGDALD